VSTQQEPASGSALEDKKKVFRLPAPLVLWWAWVAFAVVNLADLAIQGHDATSVQIAIGLLAITGVVYACAFRPRVITDAGGLTMLNPLREYRVPWARVSDVYLGESVQVRCTAAATANAKGKGKVLHSWALYSPRRSRLKAEVRGRRMDRNLVSRPGGYARMPVEAREVAKQHPAELMAREIQSLAQKARERGAPDGPVVASWAWSSLAAVLVPALLLALVIVIS
jgi:signal transduction histidine kinase